MTTQNPKTGLQRRRFIQRGVGTGAVGAAVAGSLATVAAPAVAQTNPAVRWRMVASFPKTLDTCFGSTADMCKRIGDITEGRFQITLHGPGEIVPALQVMDAVSKGTVECGQAFSSFYFGTNPAFIFDAGLAFGLNPRQQNAWMYYGGGLELVRELYAKYNCYPMPIGNFGVQMGGWFRKEIKSRADLRGVKMRIGGFGGMVMSRMGVTAQQLPGGEIFAAMEKGVIDAAEFVGPYDDEKLGLNRIAKFYYAPGWWEGSAQMTALVNTKAWADLPAAYKAAFEVAACEANLQMLARYDAKNPAAIRALVGRGTQLKWFPRDVMDEAMKTANTLYDELSSTNEDFKKLYASWTKFRDEQVAWYRVADHYLDSYTINALSRRT